MTNWWTDYSLTTTNSWKLIAISTTTTIAATTTTYYLALSNQNANDFSTNTLEIGNS